MAAKTQSVKSIPVIVEPPSCEPTETSVQTPPNAFPSRLLKKDFSQPAPLTVIAPQGRELKESSQSFRRALKANILGISKSFVVQHPASNPRRHLAQTVG